MFCNNCGKEIIGESKYCNHCGSKIILKKSGEKLAIVEQAHSESSEDYIWTCDYCGKEFNSKSESDSHEKECEKNPNNFKNNNLVACVKCGTENLIEAKFCKKCGNDMSTEQYNYAGFWIRFGAWLIDYAVILLLAFVVLIIMAIFGYDISNIDSVTDWIISLGTMIAYFIFCPAVWSTTLGKRIYGLSMLKENGEKLDWGTSLKRAIMQPLSLFFFLVGYRGMEKNGKQQAWHDRESHTFVIKKDGIKYFFPIILSILGFFIYIWVRSLSEST